MLFAIARALRFGNLLVSREVLRLFLGRRGGGGDRGRVLVSEVFECINIHSVSSARNLRCLY